MKCEGQKAMTEEGNMNGKVTRTKVAIATMVSVGALVAGFGPAGVIIVDGGHGHGTPQAGVIIPNGPGGR